MYIFGIIIILLFTVSSGLSQHSYPDTIVALRIDKGEIQFDGNLDEDIWERAMHIKTFTQRELNYGEPVSEPTEVAVVYTQDELYFGVWCYQSQAVRITAKHMSRDFYYRVDDNFQIMISPFDDNRNGYLFVINPYGARADLLISGGESANRDWNGVWDVKTVITDKGWFAEVYIPFNTLQFKKQREHIWAINFERDIVSKNEQALWQGWSRDFSIYYVVNAGKLVGIKDIGYTKRFEFLPYGLGGYVHDHITGKEFLKKAGADLNIYLSPTLKLNLTTFTDFAQVEADKIVVNLTRFNQYYPEKRAFFLEGSNLYRFCLGNRNKVFYTRTIGIENHETVPIIAGVRLFGKEGKNNIGFLNILEGKLDTISQTNNTVFRYKRDIGTQSYIGCIFTNKINDKASNQVFGIDHSYQTSRFLKDKNLIISTKLALSADNFELKSNSLAYRFFIDYPNDLIDNYISISSLQSNFNPGLGFLWRRDYIAYNWNLDLMPRIFTKYGFRKFLFKPWEVSLFQTQSTGKIESFYNETCPLGFIFKSGDVFKLNLQQSYDRLDQPFYLTNTINVDSGEYRMFRNEIQFSSYHSRRIWLACSYNWGDFYSGKIQTFESGAGFNLSKHFNFRIEYKYNTLELASGSLTTHEFAYYSKYAFNPKLYLMFFVQWNSLEELLFFNFRVQWIPKIGSDFYFVFNNGYYNPIKQIELLKPQTSTTVAKLVYRITF